VHGRSISPTINFVKYVLIVGIASLTGQRSVPEPLARDTAAEARLVDAVSHDLRNEDGLATATAVRMIWTGDHLDAARRLQDSLVGPARAATVGGADGRG
jgi:hypothetical protein